MLPQGKFLVVNPLYILVEGGTPMKRKSNLE